MLWIVSLSFFRGGDCSAIIGVHADTADDACLAAKEMLLKVYANAKYIDGDDASLHSEKIHHVEAKKADDGLLFLDEA